MWGVSGRDAFIYVWSVKNGKQSKKLTGHDGRVTALVVVDKHVWSTATDMSIRVWSAKSFKPTRKMAVQNLIVSMHHHAGRVWLGTESAIQVRCALVEWINFM